MFHRKSAGLCWVCLLIFKVPFLEWTATIRSAPKYEYTAGRTGGLPRTEYSHRIYRAPETGIGKTIGVGCPFCRYFKNHLPVLSITYIVSLSGNLIKGSYLPKLRRLTTSPNDDPNDITRSHVHPAKNTIIGHYRVIGNGSARGWVRCTLLRELGSNGARYGKRSVWNDEKR